MPNVRYPASARVYIDAWRAGVRDAAAAALRDHGGEMVGVRLAAQIKFSKAGLRSILAGDPRFEFCHRPVHKPSGGRRDGLVVILIDAPVTGSGMAPSGQG